MRGIRSNRNWRGMVESQSPGVQERINLHDPEMLKMLSDEDLQALINQAEMEEAPPPPPPAEEPPFDYASHYAKYPPSALERYEGREPRYKTDEPIHEKDIIDELTYKLRQYGKGGEAGKALQQELVAKYGRSFPAILEASGVEEPHGARTERLLKERLSEAEAKKAERRLEIFGGQQESPIFQTPEGVWTNIGPSKTLTPKLPPIKALEKLIKEGLATDEDYKAYKALKEKTPTPKHKADLATKAFDYINQEMITSGDTLTPEEIDNHNRNLNIYGFKLRVKAGNIFDGIESVGAQPETQKTKATKKDKYGFSLGEVQKGYTYIGNNQWQRQ